MFLEILVINFLAAGIIIVYSVQVCDDRNQIKDRQRGADPNLGIDSVAAAQRDQAALIERLRSTNSSDFLHNQGYSYTPRHSFMERERLLAHEVTYLTCVEVSNKEVARLEAAARFEAVSKEVARIRAAKRELALIEEANKEAARVEANNKEVARHFGATSYTALRVLPLEAAKKEAAHKSTDPNSIPDPKKLL